MFGLFGGNDHALLVATLKAVVVILVLSVLATKYLADGSLDQPALSRLAAEAAKGKGEPSMTGSINRVRLDPCAAPRRS